jgi:hypothetical protein
MVEEKRIEIDAQNIRRDFIKQLSRLITSEYLCHFLPV